MSNLLAGLASALQGKQSQNNLNTAKPSVAGSVLSNMMGNRQNNTWGQPDAGIGAIASLLGAGTANAQENPWGGTSNKSQNNQMMEEEAWRIHGKRKQKNLREVTVDNIMRMLQDKNGVIYQDINETPPQGWSTE